MLWHRGDPAGRTWHESLGIRFNPISAGKVAVLLEMLLMTSFYNVLNALPERASYNPSPALSWNASKTDKHSCSQADGQKQTKRQKTKLELTNHDSNGQQTLKYECFSDERPNKAKQDCSQTDADKLAKSPDLNLNIRDAAEWWISIKRDGFLDSFLFLTKLTRIKQHLNWWTKLLSNASTCYLKQMKVCYNIHQIKHIQTPVSYTHLTLPTILLV